MKKIVVSLFVILSIFLVIGCNSSNEPLEEVKYCVTFDSQGGSVVSSQTVISGSKVNKPNDPTKTGYQFEDWYKEKTYQNVWDFNKNTITKDITLYAKWKEIPSAVEEKYSITFNMHEHGKAPSSIRDVNALPNPLPKVEDVKGFQFKGWYLDEKYQEPAEAGKEIKANTILHAKWEEVTPPAQKKYSVAYVTNGHGNQPNNLTDVTALPAALPNLTADGFTFNGWYVDEKFTTLAVAGTILSANVTLYAKWTENQVIPPKDEKYSISFNSQEHGTAPEKIENVSSLPTTLPALEEEGWVFIGWYLDAEFKNKAKQGAKITENTTLYAKWRIKVDWLPYLKDLLNNYYISILDFIPTSMQHEHIALLGETDLNTLDFSSNVDISKIPTIGYGEQWHMVIDNIEQASSLNSLLNVIGTISQVSLSGYDMFLNSNIEDVSTYSFEYGIYKIYIHFEDSIMHYSVKYTGSLPLFGTQNIQIDLSKNILDGTKTCRVQVGDANAVKMVYRKNKITLALKYANVRTSYIEISKNNSMTTGMIHETLIVKDKEITSAADFYFDDTYGSVVGNKASGMIAFSGFINEVYSLSSGKMLGYEVRETLSAIQYNTLWFHLEDTSGITSVAYKTNADSKESFFTVNGASTAFLTKKVGGLSPKSLSRRYDIEFRTMYFTSYNFESEKYITISKEIPMFFVQEEQLKNVSSDVTTENSNIPSFSIVLNNNDLAKIKKDYETLIDIFIENKEKMKEEDIITYLGAPLTY